MDSFPIGFFTKYYNISFNIIIIILFIFFTGHPSRMISIGHYTTKQNRYITCGMRPNWMWVTDLGRPSANFGMDFSQKSVRLLVLYSFIIYINNNSVRNFIIFSLSFKVALSLLYHTSLITRLCFNFYISIFHHIMLIIYIIYASILYS